MQEPLKLPLFEEVLPGGLRFGANYLVEFEPQSLWYETSLTLCAQALRRRIKTDYHTFTHPPGDIRRELERFGLPIDELEADDTFRVMDSYTVQTGLGTAEKVGKASPRDKVDIHSVRISDWDKGAAEELSGEISETDKRRLHVDDNTSVLVQFNDEKTVVEHFRRITLPYARKLELAAIHSVATGTFSEGFYRQFESFCDGIIDFRASEDAKRMVHEMRLRVARSAGHDSRWRRLEVLGSGEVAVKGDPSSPVEASAVETPMDRGPASRSTKDGERRLAAIMFTDISGFTALGQRDEALAMELLEKQRTTIRPLLARFRGREVKTMGDAFLVEFPSALEAVTCSVELQAAMRDENLKRPEERRVLMRIGIHLGDVIHTGEDVAGDAVNVASRIEKLAPPGGICVTGQVHGSVVNKVECEFETLGTPELKNVSTPIEVFRIAGYGQAVMGNLPPKALLAKDRVAVLPLANISPDPKDEYFADGMTEELISSISKVAGLKVIARTSVMRYKGKDASTAQVGRELGVGNLLEGSVRKQGNRVRIAVQLVDVASEEQKWSDEYDRELQDIFAIQRDISQKVASALKVYVLQGELKAIARDPTRSPEAYEQYLRGRQLWNRRTGEDLARSVELFGEALRIDPGYAMAYSGLADAYSALALLEFMPPSEAFPKAKAAVQEALRIDDALSEAHTSLGLIRFQYDWDWGGAEEEFRVAIELNQNYPPAHQFYADYLKAMGRFDEAIREMEKARELDPLSLAISSGLGHVLYLSRQYDRAIERYRKTVEMDPSFMQTHLWFGRPYLEKGMYDEAISELQTAVRLSGEGTLALGMLGHGLASSGRTEEARAILEKLRKRSAERYVPSYWIAAVYNGMRDRDQVLVWLKKAVEERSSWLVWIGVEPRFDWLRGDPEYESLIRNMKFPEGPFKN